MLEGNVSRQSDPQLVQLLDPRFNDKYHIWTKMTPNQTLNCIQTTTNQCRCIFSCECQIEGIQSKDSPVFRVSQSAGIQNRSAI